jgi:hypothetical protein
MTEISGITLNRRQTLRRLGVLGVAAPAALHAFPAAAQEGTPVAGAEAACLADPRLGSVVSVTGPEGTEVMQLTVSELRDPFTEYDPAGPPPAGQRFVIVRLSVEVTGPRPIQVDPRHYLLQDAEGYLYRNTNIRLSQDATEALLARVDLTPGSRVEGLIGYAVLRDATVTRFHYQPENTRQILVADLRDRAPTP